MKLASKTSAFLTAAAVALPAIAQDWYKVNVHSESDKHTTWGFPYDPSHFSHFDFSADESELRAHRIDEQEASSWYIPFAVSTLDSITFVNELPEEEQTHNKYQVYSLNVTVDGGADVVSKDEYVGCYVSLDGRDGYNMYSGTGRIRGRGNSTWAWYDKKPYRIKLDRKQKMLGLDKNKDWVLLANYRDVTDLMNTFMFETARWMGMPYCNHTRYVELFLNGDYKGLYQLTEQVEQGKNRVDIAANGGILLAMDVDDGPDGQTATDQSFWSKVYRMPMCVKYPDDATREQVDSVKVLLGELEQAIKNVDYEALESLMDMKSFMTMAMLQEYCYNVEMSAPRSIYMYKHADGKWAMGPFWDWDAGFDFDWSEMYTGHVYFNNYSSLLLGTAPGTRVGTRGGLPRYFTDMFQSARYTKEYKTLWNSARDSIFTRNWAEMEKYITELGKGAYGRDFQRWPLTKSSWYGATEQYVISDEIQKMKNWLEHRTSFLDKIINAYPESNGTGQTYGIIKTTMAGSVMDIYLKLQQSANYSQAEVITIDPVELGEMLGLSASEISRADISLNVLNSDGKVAGKHTAQGTWGCWFDAHGNVVDYYGASHVYVEPSNLSSSDIYSWNYGCHPNNCHSGDVHIVKLQYVVRLNGQTLNVTVNVHFGIDCNPLNVAIADTGPFAPPRNSDFKKIS